MPIWDNLHGCSIPIPEGYPQGQGTRIVQPFYDGAVFDIAKRVVVADRLQVWLTALSDGPSLSFAIYRADEPAAAYPFAWDEGPTAFREGKALLLVGRSSALGSATLRTYTMPNLDLLNRNVGLDYYPTRFTTLLPAASGPPLTFDPRPAPAGQAIESLVDLTPIIRLRNTT